MNRTVEHNTFVIERDYAASAARVYAAFADPKQKLRWFGDTSSESTTTHEIDFRVGGQESLRGDAPDGVPSFTYDARYQDIVEGSRIVYSYEMTMDGRRISVSVATIEFVATEQGTHFILTEQGVFLDGLDTGAIREQGTRDLLAALDTYLKETA
jgi:uncharacterized protein YndB with AHSA1/START domain